MRQRIKIILVEQTCNACPSQWEALTADLRRVYVRYRHGFLSVIAVGRGILESGPASNAETVYDRLIDDTCCDGEMTYDELVSVTRERIRWPKEPTPWLFWTPLELAQLANERMAQTLDLRARRLDLAGDTAGALRFWERIIELPHVPEGRRLDALRMLSRLSDHPRS